MSVFFPLANISFDRLLDTENNDNIELLCFYDKLTQYYYNTKNYIAALQICYKYKNFDRLFSILENKNCSFITRTNFYLIEKYFLESPLNIKCKYIKTTLNILYIFLLCNNYLKFDEINNELFEYILNSNINFNEKQKIIGYMLFEYSFCIYNDIDIMFNYYQKSYELLGETAFRDYGNALDLLSTCVPSFVYAFHNKLGKLQSTVFYLSDHISNYYRLTNNHNFGIENIFASEWLYLQGKVVESKFLAQNALCSSEQYGKGAISISSYFILARISIILGEYTKISETLQHMRTIADEHDNTIYYSAVDFCEAHIYGILGHNEFIKEWISDSNTEHRYDKVNFTNITNYFITHIRCLINDKKYNTALSFMETFIKESKPIKHICIDIYYNMYCAIIFNMQGEHIKALEYLRISLELAVPDKLYMIFAENYTLLEDMLKELYFNDEFCNDITNIADYGERISWWIQRFEKEHFCENNIAI